MLRRLWKPWFVYRPLQLFRRSAAWFLPPLGGYAPIRTSWGATVIADPARAIGHSIHAIGLYDLPVSEALFRLISPGDTVVDAGANVGYMTILASVAAGPRGRVVSFEPHPELFAVLQQNVAALRARQNFANVDPYQTALGNLAGTAELQVPSDFGSNDGIAKIGSAATPAGQVVTVQVMTLDEVLGNASVGVLKLDVEGFESYVLQGSRRLLSSRRIRDVVFEDHEIAQSEVVRLLRDAGYRLFSLGWSMRGPIVRPIEAGGLATPHDAPSFIATLEPELVLARFRPKGWLALSSRTASRKPGP